MATEGMREFELAGLADGETGEPPAVRSPTDRWYLPKRVDLVTADGQPWLCGDWMTNGILRRDDLDSLTQRSTSVQMTPAFLRLRTATDAAICTYARRYGVLRICQQHGLPMPAGSHLVALPGIGSHEPHGGHLCSPRLLTYELEGGLYRGEAESPRQWRQLADELDALLTAVALLVREADVPDEVWARLERFDPPGEFQGWSRRRDERGWLIDVVNRLSDIAGLTWRITDWNQHGRPRALLTTSTLFAGLMAQMQSYIAGTGFATCSHCGRPYEVIGPQPAATRRNFCPDCRTNRVPQRYAEKAARERRSAKKESSDG